MADLELGGVLREPLGQRAAGRGAVERLPDGRRLRGGDRRQRRLGLRPPVRGDGPARAGHRRALRHPWGPWRATWPSSTSGSAAWTATLTGDGLLDRLDEHGVPAGQIFTAREMLRDPHYQAREMVLRHRPTQGWDVPMTGVVPKLHPHARARSAHRASRSAHDTDRRAARAGRAAADDELAELDEAGLI